MTNSDPSVAPDDSGSHYARIGGGAAVKEAVRLFYDRVLADPQLAGYFTTVDMQEQKRHMVLMLTTVLGGPDAYSGRTLAEAHKPLDIPHADYDRVGEHLLAVLAQLDVPADIRTDVAGVLAAVRSQVVSDRALAGA